jgi:hypothetical protein
MVEYEMMTTEAIIKGLDLETGYLRAISVVDQREILLQPDGNSFDMIKGLISQKSS